jgi:transcriptional regulator with XRE-family HTH domain
MGHPMARPATVPMLLGRRVRALRTLRRYTQEKLGERAAVSTKFLGQIERGVGNPSLQILVRLAQALGVELWELLRFEEIRADGAPRNAVRGYAAAEAVTDYLASRPPADIERALKILEAALGEGGNTPTPSKHPRSP